MFYISTVDSAMTYQAGPQAPHGYNCISTITGFLSAFMFDKGLMWEIMSVDTNVKWIILGATLVQTVSTGIDGRLRYPDRSQ